MNPNYKTLHNDIGMVQRTNNGWDLWFDNGDLVKADDLHSLQVGIIIACLTSWNYLNRYGNPTYQVFGNRSYELLKANKGNMVAYKIQQYFIEVLKRMRRVYEIVYLEVTEKPSKPYTYYVEFEVISITNQIVDGSFEINADTSKSSSYIDYTMYMPYCSNDNELIIDLWLKNEYGGGLGDEILYMYLKKGDNDYEFMGVVGKTDDDGYLRVTYEPANIDNEWFDKINDSKKPSKFQNNETNQIYFDYHGNTTYNPSRSKETTFKTEIYDYNISFINEDILTYNDYADLTIRLYKQSLLDDSIILMSDTVVTVLGSDGRVYNATTDSNGEAKIRVSFTENTAYTTLYGDSDVSETSVTIIKQTPNITLNIDNDNVIVNETVTLTGTVLDEFGVPISNHSINILDDDEILMSLMTGDNGEINVSLNGLSVGNHTLSLSIDEDNWYESSKSNDIILSIVKNSPVITLSTNPSICSESMPITLIANATINNVPMNDVPITFSENNTVLGEATIINGVASITLNNLSRGEHTIIATITNEELYNDASETLLINVLEDDYNISFEYSDYTITNTADNHNTLPLTVILTNNTTPAPDKTIIITSPRNQTYTAQTDTDGKAGIIINDVGGSGELTCQYNNVSDTANITVLNQDVILTAIYDDDTNIVRGVLSDAYGNKLSGQRIELIGFENGIASRPVRTVSITDSDGVYYVEISSIIVPVVVRFDSPTTEYRSKAIGVQRT